MNMIDSIQKVLNTLNTIPVAGVEFQDRMIGCVNILASMRCELENEAKEAKANDDPEN